MYFYKEKPLSSAMGEFRAFPIISVPYGLAYLPCLLLIFSPLKSGALGTFRASL